MEEIVYAGEVPIIMGLGARTLEGWIDVGAVKPITPTTGKGSRRIFTPLVLLQVAIVQELRTRGFSITQAAGVCAAMRSHHLGRLEPSFAAGRTMLLAFGDGAFPELLEASAIPAEQIVAASAARLPVAVVDLQAILRQIREKLATRQAAPEAN